MSAHQGGWSDLLARVGGGTTVYVVGATDTGKTTLSHQLLSAAGSAGGSAAGSAAAGEPSWYLDCDPGQSVVGPPTTLGLARVYGTGGGDGTAGTGDTGASGTGDGPSVAGGVPAGASAAEAGPALSAPRFETVALSFVGSTSPARHLLQTVCAVARLVDEAPPSGLLVCDSSGFVSGRGAGDYQYNLITLVRPDIVVALEADAELRNTLAPFDGAPDIEVRYMSRDEACRSKSRAARADYRNRLFSRYFAGATQQRLDLSRTSLHGMGPDARGTSAAAAPASASAVGAGASAAPPPAAWRNRVCALLDGRQLVVALGIVLRAEIEELEILMPPLDDDAIASVQLGSHKLFPEDLTYQTPPE